ncbi:hypothetical protein C3F36_07560 [Aeromonas sp. ASNIH2]|nr:hypothetical protein C3F36_07560 [Aeromonas sp. ASNIH2]
MSLSKDMRRERSRLYFFSEGLGQQLLRMRGVNAREASFPAAGMLRLPQYGQTLIRVRQKIWSQ